MEERMFKVLLVDDEKNVLNSLFWALKTMKQPKCEFVKASSGDEALNILQNEEFDLIISDHRMPEMTGVTLLEKVKSLHPKMKKILLTGCSDLGIVKEAINKAKIDLYLEKPWNINDLRENISSVLASIQEQDDLLMNVSCIAPEDLIEQIRLSSKELRDNNKEDPIKLMFEFNSTEELNTFNKLAEDMKFLQIDKVDSFSNKYVIAVTVYPEYKISFLQECR